MLSKAQIKYIRLLQRKKIRYEQRLFIAEGEKVVHEFLESKAPVKAIYATPAWLKKNNLLVEKNKIPAEEISESELRQISTLTTPHQVLALIHFLDAEELKSERGIYLALDGIRDPGNMGTLIRTADWFNISGIFCSPDCVDIYNPKVVQASMGSLAHVKFQYHSLDDLLKKNKKLTVWAATLQGKNVFKQKHDGNLILVIGSEAEGISESLLNYASKEVMIPKHGKAESLNASIAAGIMLAHLKENA